MMKLTPEEIALSRELGFEEEVFEFVKSHAHGPVIRAVRQHPDGEMEPGAGLSIAVKDGEEAEKLMTVLREFVDQHGYRAFWSERHEPNGLKQTDEFVVFKTHDSYAMIRACGSDGGNYDISTEDIIDRLETWKELCSYDVVGASRDWVALQFSRLPENICTFAEEVYLFCPDSVTQGIGFTDRHNKKKIDAASKLCPTPISAKIREKLSADADRTVGAFGNQFGDFQQRLFEEVENGIRLLAYELHQKKFLFLWWD